MRECHVQERNVGMVCEGTQNWAKKRLVFLTPEGSRQNKTKKKKGGGDLGSTHLLELEEGSQREMNGRRQGFEIEMMR